MSYTIVKVDGSTPQKGGFFVRAHDKSWEWLAIDPFQVVYFLASFSII